MSKIVIKLGGQVFSQDLNIVKTIVTDIIALKESGLEPILVHGGGMLIDQELKAAGVVPQKKDGLRITDAATMKVVQKVLDQVNADLTTQFSRFGLQVKGFASHNTPLQAEAAQAIGLDGLEFDLGFVGDITSVDVATIVSAVDAGLTPLVAPIAIGATEDYYNINADSAAAAIAEFTNAEMLVYMSDVPGVIGANNIGVKTLRKAHCDHLTAKGTVSGGMLAKLHSAFKAAESGVACVQIIDGTEPHSLIQSIKQPGYGGTLIAC
jgi:acetylglutamate kinase